LLGIGTEHNVRQPFDILSLSGERGRGVPQPRGAILLAAGDSDERVLLDPLVFRTGLFELVEAHLELVCTLRSGRIVIGQSRFVGAAQTDEVVALASVGFAEIRKLELQQ
jgi:hypothetical protein